MKTTLRSVKVFIIDEISMVSSLNLAYIHLRLEELFGSNDWFGSKNMLFVGDLQLQPVNGHPVFEKITQKSLQHKLGCSTSVNIWRDVVTYDELTINERQKMPNFQQCWIPYAVAVQLLKPSPPFRNGSFKGALQTNSFNFGNTDSHLSVPQKKNMQ